MKLCVVIPVYNHEGTLPAMLDSLKAYGLPCILVNDGSSQACGDALERLRSLEPQRISLSHLPENLGKGGAVMAGLRQAQSAGFTHALQIDADGQHQASDLPRFMEAADKDPEALICGVPLFDASAPKSRLYGRLATRIWIWINTLSFQIQDAMCGFRIYPLHSTVALMDEVHLGRRMDFDPEILVRLSWKGLRVVGIPTQVLYPQGGSSHFRLLQDNWLISRMHAKLFFGMLFRSPLLLWRKCRPNTGPISPKSALPGA
jgi:glycosyltransferase involved in cell wall biosynthesis